MSRSRIVKPEFFRHSELYQAEVEAGLPLRLAFEGLWTVADREGRFVWRPTELKLDVLPYDPVDFAAVLDALESRGFIKSYVVDGKRYGHVPSFHEHQTFHPHEAKSKLPVPTLVTNGEQCPPVSISVSTSISASISDSSVAKATGDEPPPGSPFHEAMGAVREHLRNGGRPDGRDGTVILGLLGKHSVQDVVRAVEGLRQLVDRGNLPPIPKGQSVPSTLLESPKWGINVFSASLDAYYSMAPPEPTKRVKSGPTSLGEEIGKAFPELREAG